VQSPRTPCGGVYFEHAQNQRRGLAFPQHVRQHAMATLWGLLERRGRVVSAPRARCKDAVFILHLGRRLQCILIIKPKIIKWIKIYKVFNIINANGLNFI